MSHVNGRTRSRQEVLWREFLLQRDTFLSTFPVTPQKADGEGFASASVGIVTPPPPSPHRSRLFAGSVGGTVSPLQRLVRRRGWGERGWRGAEGRRVWACWCHLLTATHRVCLLPVHSQFEDLADAFQYLYTFSSSVHLASYRNTWKHQSRSSI